MKNNQKNQSKTSSPQFTQKRFTWIYIAILVFALLLRIFRLDQPREYYFDEVYHAFTAKVYLQNDPVGYDIWATPPQGLAYEWTHPPLAKLMMAGTMAVVGENSFGWRLSSALFGTGVIAATMLIARKLFHSKPIALLSGLFLSLDGLLLAQSRIAMNDTHFLFFALNSLLFYIYWKEKKIQWKYLFVSSLCIGLALASKWTTLYVLGFIALDLLFQLYKKQLTLTIKNILALGSAYILIPAIVYIGSYFQFFSFGYHWSEFIELQKQMWWYHTNLKATHPYQSIPWQWIFDLRPVWMWTDQIDSKTVANIYNLGNPIFFWSGFLSILAGIYSVRKRYNASLWFLILWYFCMWLPWIRSPRVMFFYHYLPALPPMSIVLAVFSANLMGWGSPAHSSMDTLPYKKYGLGIVMGLIILSTSWLVIFYPNLIGLPVSKEFANSVYFFIQSWR